MREIGNTIVRLWICISTVFMIGLPVGFSQVNHSFTYQGYVTSLDDNLPIDGEMKVTFQLYNDENTEDAIWRETHFLTLNNGLINAYLGSITPFDIDFNQPLWLGVTMDDGVELSPRTKVNGSPMSMMSLSVAPGVAVQSMNGLTDHIELIGGEHVDVDVKHDRIEISVDLPEGGDGEITSIETGEGLEGGGNSGNISIKIADQSITTQKLASNAVNSSKIADQSIGSEDLADGSISTAKLENGSIEEEKIANRSISDRKIQDNTVVRSLNGATDEVTIEGSGLIGVERSGNKITITSNNEDSGLEIPVTLHGNSNQSILSLRNFSDQPALSAIGSRGQRVLLGQGVSAAECTSSNGNKASIGVPTAAINASNSESSTSGSLAHALAGIIGSSSNSENYAGLFLGTVEIRGEQLVEGRAHFEQGATFSGTTIVDNKGDRAVLLHLNSDRSWQFRQLGTGAGTALELLSIGGGGNKNFLVSTTGQVGISTTNPQEKLHVNGSILADDFKKPSSRRWKTNIETITSALDQVTQLRGVSYQWKNGGKQDIGLIAEEVGSILPELVDYEENGIDARSVDYVSLIALLIEAIKEQQLQINHLINESE